MSVFTEALLFIDKNDHKKLSIHPRNWRGWGNRQVLNTCKPWKGGGKLKKRRERLARRRLSHSQTLKTISVKIPPAAFKLPGSMNQRKMK